MSVGVLHMSVATPLRMHVARAMAMGALVVWAVIASIVPSAADGATQQSPEAVLKAYLTALYSKDAAVAYAHLSRLDQNAKSLPDYQSETGQLSGAALQLASAMARHIRYRDMALSHDGDTATVTFGVDLPNANHADLRALAMDFDEKALSRLGEPAVRQRIMAIRQMAEAGVLPMLAGERERWTLVHEEGRWRVFLNWAGAVEVHLESITMKGLDWQFEPVRNRVLVLPGDTVQINYRARNIGSSETTGKARHAVMPPESAGNIEIVSCFCFIEQTLSPGEEVELPLVLRVDYDAPENLRQITVRYEFFPVGAFPEGS